MSTQSRYATLVRGISGPKVKWLMDQLALANIDARTQHGPIGGTVIKVDKTKLLDATGILEFQVGLLYVDSESVSSVVTVMDLGDDHPLFSSDEDIESIGPDIVSPNLTLVPIDPAAVAVPASTDNDDLFGDLEVSDPFAGLEVVPPALPPPTPVAEPVPVPPVPEIIAAELAPAQPLDPTLVTDAPADNTIDWSFDEEGPAVEGESEAPASDPELDWQRADTMLPTEDVTLPGVANPVHMYGVESENLLGIGRNISQAQPDHCTMYVLFAKSGMYYRYGLVSLKRFNMILSEAVRRQDGNEEAIVGSLFHNLIKVESEAGNIQCQKLKNDRWEQVLPKAQRVKDAKLKATK